MLEKDLSRRIELTRDIDDYGMALTGITPSVIECIQILRKTTERGKKSINEVIDSMADPSGWDQRDVGFIAGYTQKEFYEWLIDSTDPKLITKLKPFRDRIGDGEVADSVRHKFDAALRLLAARSKIDEFRVRNGVCLDAGGCDMPRTIE